MRPHGLWPLILLAAGCPAPEKPAQYPPRPPGCEVQVSADVPPVPVDNIGPVMASCTDSTERDCLRTLQDQACKLGADVVWGVDKPEVNGSKMHFHGRAAHTRAPR